MPYGSISVDQINNTTGYSLGAGNATAMKNRLINGAMVRDQRNAGGSVTANDATFGVDRWSMYAYASNKGTMQQNAGSVTPPAGFTNYLGFTSSSAYSVPSGEAFALQQRIEGYNVADLGWGTANAKTVTLSFWARSSLTGTFGGALSCNATASYAFSYSIPTANTWTQISVTVPGSQIATWNTTNGVGMYVFFGLGVGSNLSGTPGSWVAANYQSATGATSVVGTSGATFYITGVQLEVGSVATGYEYRNIQQELSLCQRYFETSYDLGTALGNVDANSIARVALGIYGVNSASYGSFVFKVTKRAQPTVTFYNGSGTAGQLSVYPTSGGSATIAATTNATGFYAINFTIASTGYSFAQGNFAASAEL